jgi:hypothetical protein
LFGRLLGKKTFQYRCDECGKIHKGSPSFSYNFPTYYFDVSESEREGRVRISDDLCEIAPSPEDVDGATIYCIRVILEIPIKGSKEPMTWGVWVSQSKESYDKYIETFDDDQSSFGSFGWLAVNLPYYTASDADEPLQHLECDIEWSGIGQRPKAILWEDSHPLAIDQRNGISWQKAVKIAHIADKIFHT